MSLAEPAPSASQPCNGPSAFRWRHTVPHDNACAMGTTEQPIIGAPAWARNGTPARAFAQGLAVAATTPGIVLFLTAIGFGTLVRDAGLWLGHALFLTLTLYALPAQVMVIDQLQRDVAPLAIAFAVTLTGVRLLPMTASLLPYLRVRGRPVLLQLLAVHMIAITAWVEGNRRLPVLPEDLRLPHFLGLGLGTIAATASGATVGYLVAARIPPTLQMALLFMTPVYFLLSTLLGASHRRDWLAIGLGAVLAPAVYLIAPSFDLLAAGLIGGTIAYLAGRGR